MLNIFTKNENILIYGASMVAKEVGSVISSEPIEANILAFVVSDMQGNPCSLMGKKVITFNEAKKTFSSDIKVVVACLERNVDEIVSALENGNFTNYVVLSFESDLWASVRKQFFNHICKKNNEPYLFLGDGTVGINNLGSEMLSVFCANSHFDKILHEDTSVYSWEIPIQVGAGLTDKRICSLKDNTGENISIKNASYCELTGLYWIWRNYKSEYKGLAHYRRHFILNHECAELIGNSEIDVIVTVPIFNFPSVKNVYAHDHIEEDWEVMMDAILDLCPEYHETALKIQDGIYYFAYNMFVAKEKIFNQYCEWLFPILEYCERKCKIRDDKYQKRFIGFLAERLMTIFFVAHKNEYKIGICNKHFVEK